MTRKHCNRWLRVAQCEAGGRQWSITHRSLHQIRWRLNSTYDGGLQFSRRTWRSNVARIPARQLTPFQRQQRARGVYAYAYRAPSSVQILAAEVLRRRIGGNPHQSAGWPTCGSRF